MDTKFLPYQDKDYPDLMEMIFSLYREDPEGEPIDEEKIKRTIAEARKNPGKLAVYMIRMEEKTIGYGILVNFWSNEYGGDILTVDEIFVKEEYRNQGIGTEFFVFAEKMADKVAMQIETTPSNERARNYYNRMGFEADSNTHLIKKR